MPDMVTFTAPSGREVTVTRANYLANYAHLDTPAAEPDMPAKNAGREAWAKYATAQGVIVEDGDRRGDIQAKLGLGDREHGED